MSPTGSWGTGRRPGRRSGAVRPRKSVNEEPTRSRYAGGNPLRPADNSVTYPPLLPTAAGAHRCSARCSANWCRGSLAVAATLPAAPAGGWLPPRLPPATAPARAAAHAPRRRERRHAAGTGRRGTARVRGYTADTATVGSSRWNGRDQDAVVTALHRL